MAIYLTGDTHGSHSLRKLATRRFPSSGLTRDDYVVILGDFGLVWGDPPTAEERYWLDWLEAKPFTTLFIDGNHENHPMLAALPEREWRGGRVHCVRPHVLHLMRGFVFDIGGAGVFAMGGAHSTDRERRTEGVSWWPEEVPGEEERARALENLDAAGWKVDLVLTHQPPARAVQAASLPDGPARCMHDEFALWLQERVCDRLDFGMWYSGHMHVDQAYLPRQIGLYGSVVKVSDDLLGFENAGGNDPFPA